MRAEAQKTGVHFHEANVSPQISPCGTITAPKIPQRFTTNGAHERRRLRTAKQLDDTGLKALDLGGIGIGPPVGIDRTAFLFLVPVFVLVGAALCATARQKTRPQLYTVWKHEC